MKRIALVIAFLILSINQFKNNNDHSENVTLLDNGQYIVSTDRVTVNDNGMLVIDVEVDWPFDESWLRSQLSEPIEFAYDILNAVYVTHTIVNYLKLDAAEGPPKYVDIDYTQMTEDELLSTLTDWQGSTEHTYDDIRWIIENYDISTFNFTYIASENSIRLVFGQVYIDMCFEENILSSINICLPDITDPEGNAVIIPVHFPT